MRSLNDTYHTGLKLLEEDKCEEAIKLFDDIIPLRPLVAAAYVQRGRCHWEMKRWDLALPDFENCLRIDPENGDAKWTVGLINLQLGNFARGWEYYDSRWDTETFKSPRLKTRLPAWERGKGYKSVLVWCEQGVGDQMIYASLLNAVKKETEKVTAMVDIRLVNMLQRANPDINFIRHDSKVQNSEYDSQIPIGSLGRHFINEAADIKKHRSVSYIYPDRSRLDHLQHELKIQPDDFVIGISWASTAERIGNHKSIKLKDLERLWEIPNVKIVNLQYGKPDHDIEPFEKETGKIIHQTTVGNFFDLEGVVAIMSMCNAVVSVSNANVHLAGALGVPTYVLDANKLWYWNHKEGDTSLFYPNVKLYTRDHLNAPWNRQVRDIFKELKDRALSRHK